MRLLQYAQGGVFSVSASASTDAVGSGFSIASSTVSLERTEPDYLRHAKSLIMNLANRRLSPAHQQVESPQLAAE